MLIQEIFAGITNNIGQIMNEISAPIAIGIPLRVEKPNIVNIREVNSIPQQDK